MKIDIRISGGYGSGKTTMAQFLYSVLHKYGFDFKIVDDEFCRMDIEKIDLKKFDNFIPLKSEICITVMEVNNTYQTKVLKNEHVKINFGDLVGTESFKEVQDKLFNKGDENE